MKKVSGLQIGHSSIKDKDFKIECDVINDKNVEVPFSHRHYFYAIYWIHEGNGMHNIDFEEYEMRPDRVFFIKPEQVHFMQIEGSLKYSALQFTEDFMIPINSKVEKEIPVYIDIDKNEKSRIGILFNQIQKESVSRLPNSTVIIRSEINTLLLDLERMAMPISNFSILPDLLCKYREMIDKNFIKERQVQFYATQLGVCPNYMNVLTRKFLGKSALELINERTVLEIKRMLLRSDFTISEIAYRLGFNELSYFSRFFRLKTGMTPQKFRDSMNKMYQ